MASAACARRTCSPSCNRSGPRVDVPIIAAGGIVDGHGMAGAFALGAEGILMGTRFMSSVESPVHDNWKHAIADCDVTLNIEPGHAGRPDARSSATSWPRPCSGATSTRPATPTPARSSRRSSTARLDKAMVGCGESASLIDSIKTVREIIDETVDVFWEQIERLARMLQGAATQSG